jgi:hypothetical protein
MSNSTKNTTQKLEPLTPLKEAMKSGQLPISESNYYDGVASGRYPDPIRIGHRNFVTDSMLRRIRNGAMSAKAQCKKQTECDCIKRMRKLTQRIELLSAGVPQEVLDEMQFEALLWSGPEWVKLGPGQPSEAQVSTLFEKSFEAQIQRLETYWERVGRDV